MKKSAKNLTGNFILGKIKLREISMSVETSNGKTSQKLSPKEYDFVEYDESCGLYVVDEWVKNDLPLTIQENLVEDVTWFDDCDHQKIKAYHGSNTTIEKFNAKLSAQGVFWFSENKDKILNGESGASSTKYLIEVILTVKNPAGWKEYEKLGLGQIMDRGFDSIQLDDDWVIFNSKSIEIKKVTENKPIKK